MLVFYPFSYLDFVDEAAADVVVVVAAAAAAAAVAAAAIGFSAKASS